MDDDRISANQTRKGLLQGLRLPFRDKPEFLFLSVSPGPDEIFPLLEANLTTLAPLISPHLSSYSWFI